MREKIRELYTTLWTEGRKAWLKRRTAALLCVVMTTQMLVSGGGAPVFAASSKVPNPTDANVIDLKEKTGDPSEAFEYIYAKVGDTIGTGGDNLALDFYFALDDDYLSEKLNEYIEKEELVDWYYFEYGEDPVYEQLRDKYNGNYDEYLLSDEISEKLQVPEFTCTVTDGILDVEEISSHLEENKNIVTTNNDIIGTWSIRSTAAGPQFIIKLNTLIYNRTSMLANKGMQLNLTENFDEKTTVEATQGSGSVDVEINILGEGTPTATNSNYTVQKSAEVGDEIEGNDDPSVIRYTVIAKASSSNADIATGSNLSARTATDSNNAVVASGSNKNDSEIYDDEDDEDDEDAEEDSEDVELINDLLSLVPLKSNLLRNNADSGTLASDSNLAGKYISDTILDTLILEEVEYTLDGTTWQSFDIGNMDGSYDTWEDYLEDHDRVFLYQISEDTDVFGIRFTTKLGEAVWQEYASMGSLNRKFPNRASLKADDGTTTLAVSERVEPEIQWENLLDKQGLPLDVNGNTYKWTITTDGYFSDGVRLYAVDHLKDVGNTHDYLYKDIDGTRVYDPITVTQDGVETELTVTQITPTTAYDFDDLTIDQIGEMLGTSFIGESDYMATKAFVYYYSYTDSVDNTEKQAGVMLIPMAQFANGKSTITYYTDISKAAANAMSVATTIENEVKALWNWPEGKGPGPAPFGGVTIDKQYSIKVSPVSKEALPDGMGYDELTNNITWRFEVNQNGITMDTLEIVDDLEGKGMSWAGDIADREDLVLTAYNRTPVQGEDGNPVYEETGKTRRIPYSESAGEASSYYTLEDSKKLTIHFGTINPEEYYRFDLVTHIEDGEYHTSQFTMVNSASYSGAVDNKPFGPLEVQAEQPVKHNLIDKSWVSFGDEGSGTYNYDYENNTVQWKIRINEKSLPIMNAVISDALPMGTTFPATWSDAIVSAVQIQPKEEGSEGEKRGEWDCDTRTITFEGGPTIKVSVTPGSEAGYNKDTLEFRFQNKNGEENIIQEPYEITFLTSVDEDYRRNYVKSNDSATTELINTATLGGTIDGKSVSASDTAVNAAVPTPLMKQGSYHFMDDEKLYGYMYYDENGNLQAMDVEAAYVSWAAYVNQTGADMSGVTISDTVEEVFELVAASVNISKVELDARGNITGSPVPIVENGKPVSDSGVESTDISADESGFQFIIPEQYGHDTLKITFDTVLTDNASGAEMVNKLKADGEGMEDETLEVTASGADNFRFADYAQAQGMFFLRVEKSSTNSEKMTLQGAEFELTKMGLKDGETDRGQIGNWEPVSGTTKTRTSNSRGVLSFMFLQDNTMYMLKETKAPTGYELTEEVWYVIIEPVDVFPAVGIITDPSTGRETAAVVIENDKRYINQGIGNAPIGSGTEGNNLKIKKVGQNNQILAGARFELHYSWLKNPSIYKTATTGDDGILTFEDLDPTPKPDQYYILKEKTAPTGYQSQGATLAGKPLDEVRIKVSVEKKNGTDHYKIVLTDADDKALSADGESGSYIVENVPIRQSGSFKKVDQNGDPVRGGVTFNVWRRGDGGDGSGTVVMDPSSNENYLSYKGEGSDQITVKPNSSGVVELSNFYYGYYKLTEVFDKDSANNILMNAAKPVYIRVGADGMFALPREKEYLNLNDADVAALADSVYSKKLSGTEVNYPVQNDIMWGLVDVNKVVGVRTEDGGIITETPEILSSGNTVPVSGVVFAIYNCYDGEPAESELMYVMTVAGEDESAGHFDMVDKAKGLYQCYDEKGNKLEGQSKVLPLGDYCLKEVYDTNEAYEIKSDDLFNFTIGKGTFSDDQYKPALTVYIDSRGDTAEQEGGSYFLNMPIRKPVELKKVDSIYTSLTLTDAKFSVLDGETKVATLEYDDTHEKYVLKPLSTAATKNGIPYLGRENAEVPYGILPGSYTVKEINTPTLTTASNTDTYAYANGLNGTFFLKVTTSGYTISAGADDAVGVAKVDGEDVVTNRAKRGSFTLTKYMQTLKADAQETSTGSYEYKPIGGIQFRLYAEELLHGLVPVESNYYWTSTTATAQGSMGRVTFDNLVPGKYRLEELPSSVPDSYPIYSMDPIYVKVEAAESGDDAVVSFYSDSQYSQNLVADSGSETASTEKSAICDASTGTSYSLAAYNAIRVADVTGTKVASYKNGIVTATLSDAEFTLTHKALKYKFVTTSDENGVISFTDIPYGEYTVEETMVPDGYQAIDSYNITISKESVDENDTYVLKPKDATSGFEPIVDTAITVNAKFTKVDQNGDPILGSEFPAQFKVVQTKNALAAGLGGPFTGEDDSTEKTFTLGADGALTIEGLSYGEYEVTELSTGITDKLDDPEGLAHFVLIVEPWKKGEESTGTRVTVKPYPASKGIWSVLSAIWDSTVNGWHYPAALQPGETADFSSDSTISETILTNTLKYGLINIRKVRGEQTGTNTFETYSDTSPSSAMSGVKFEIYKEIDTATPYLTLTTKEDGKFPSAKANGKYTDEKSQKDKALLAGDYLLKEVGIVGNSTYKVLSDMIPFTVVDSGSTIWFSTTENNEVTVATYSNAEVESNIPAFGNVPNRGTLHFAKKDADTQEPLKGAVFGIYVNDESSTDYGSLVGYATWSKDVTDADGAVVNNIYRVLTVGDTTALAQGRNEISVLTTVKADVTGNVPYISDRNGNGWLLAGNYQLRELEVPKPEYAAMTGIDVSITDGVDYAVNGGTVTNTIHKTPSTAVLTFTKKVENATYQSAARDVFIFTLKGTPSNGDSAWTQKELTLQSDNRTFELSEIPVGEYTLYENCPEHDAYLGFDGKEATALLTIHVTNENGVVSTEVTALNETETGGIKVRTLTDPADSAHVTGAEIINQWKRGSIKGHKVVKATDSNGESKSVDLSGITFALFESEISTEPIDGAPTATTDVNGIFTFENVPYGDYWVGEHGDLTGYRAVPERQKVEIRSDKQEVVLSTPFINERILGKLALNKISATDNKPLTGAEFTVYVNAGNASLPQLGAPVAYLVESPAAKGTYSLSNTNSQGAVLNALASDGNWKELPYLEKVQDGFGLAYGDYVVVETKTPAGYQPDLEDGMLKLHPVTVRNHGEIQYIGNTETSSLNSTQFTNSRTLADLTVEKEKEMATYNGAEPEFEKAGAVSFEIAGTVVDPSGNGVALLEYLKSTNRSDLGQLIKDDNGVEKVVITTGTSGESLGKAVLKDIPAGTYTVTEIIQDSVDYEYQPGHADNAARQVIISIAYDFTDKKFVTEYEWTKGGESSNNLFRNHLKRGTVKGWKVSAYNTDAGLEGAGFGLYVEPDCSGTPVMTATSSNAEGKNGEFTFAEVPYGTYYVKEIQAPNGYIPSTMIYKVTVNAQDATFIQGAPKDAGSFTYSDEAVDMIFTNSNKRGTVSLTKRSDDGTSLKNLAEFMIYADKDCKEAVAYLTDPDANGIYTLATASNLDTDAEPLKEKNNGVSYLQVDENDQLKLIQGSYWVKETMVPDGYEAEIENESPKIYPFTLENPGTSSDETELDEVVIYNTTDPDTGEKSFVNNLMRDGFILEKTVETWKAEDLTAGETKAGVGFGFEIAGYDSAAGSGVAIAAIPGVTVTVDKVTKPAREYVQGDKLLVTTGTDGKAIITGLPIGTYTVTEVSGPDYDLYTGTTLRTVVFTQNTDKTELEATFDGNAVKLDSGNANMAAENLTFHNTLKRYNITGQKVSDDGLALAGAQFGLYSADGNTLYHTTVSSRDGSFGFTEVPVGEYVVKEIQAPSVQYLKDEVTYPVSVKADQDTQKAILVSAAPIINTLKRGTITGTKVTTANQPLAGAEIGLFPGNTTSYTANDLYKGMTAVSGEDGTFTFANVPYGTYRIMELTAPSGYRLNQTTVYEVAVTENGENITTGYRMTVGGDKAAEKTALIIENTRRSGSGGGNGGSGGSGNTGSTTPTGPVNLGPGVPTEPANPTEPTAPAGQANPEGPTEPTAPGIPEIPVNPDRTPNIAPDTVVGVYDPDHPDVPLYYGPYDPDSGFPSLAPGVYDLVMFDENGIPMGMLRIRIDDDGIPLALPKTGDSRLPVAIPAAVLLAALAGIGLMKRRRREEE